MDVKDSLAFFFYKNRARGLRFIKRLELSDVVSRLQDDLVTSLWEKDLSHITFTIVDEMAASFYSTIKSFSNYQAISLIFNKLNIRNLQNHKGKRENLTFPSL